MFGDQRGSIFVIWSTSQPYNRTQPLLSPLLTWFAYGCTVGRQGFAEIMSEWFLEPFEPIAALGLSPIRMHHLGMDIVSVEDQRDLSYRDGAVTM